MNHSNRPEKPRKDFPLYAHKVGRWAKKVRGHVCYFTRWADDPKGVEALEQWLDQKDDLIAGRKPKPKTADNVFTVEDLCDEFLTAKEGERDNGEMAPRTYFGLHATCQTVLGVFGAGRAVSDLKPADFCKLRTKLAKTRKAVALKNEIGRVRYIFKEVCRNKDLREPFYGSMFDKPKQRTIDAQEDAHREEHGDKMFDADEIRLMLDALSGAEVESRLVDDDGKPIMVKVKRNPQLTAMILLGINGGYGQSDCACLPVKAVDLETGICRFARVKTKIDRRIPLWPETIAAIREWLPLRPTAQDPADNRLMFLTRNGARWVKLNAKGSPSDALGSEFRKLTDKLGITRSRRSFYALRHSFATIGLGAADNPALSVVMGHKIGGMIANYVERFPEDRLRRVTDYVRAWLFPTEEEGPEASDPSGPSDPTRENVGPNGGATPKSSAPKSRAGSKGSKGPQNREAERQPVATAPALRLYVG